MPFREKPRLGRIQVFGLALANNTPAKPDQVATCIPYRKHDAFTKTVVAAPVVGLYDQAGLNQQSIFILGKDGSQPPPVGTRPAQAESEIGRASCRESVWTYVKISGCAGHCKKKQTKLKQ